MNKTTLRKLVKKYFAVVMTLIIIISFALGYFGFKLLSGTAFFQMHTVACTTLYFGIQGFIIGLIL